MLVKAARAMGKRTVALLTNMNQPLGRWVGNAVETREAIEVLRGNLQGDFAELCIELAAQMLMVGGLTANLPEARNRSVAALQSGAAWQKFKDVVAAQGGDLSALDFNSDAGEWTPYAKFIESLRADRAGFVSRIQTDEIGRVVMDWGGGRAKLEDPIDYAVGLYIHAKLGDRVNTGDPLVTAYFNDQTKREEMTARLRKAYEISDNPPQLEPLVNEIV
jgi:pyrimidine-nucleoside phosphorylase